MTFVRYLIALTALLNATETITAASEALLSHETSTSFSVDLSDESDDATRTLNTTGFLRPNAQVKNSIAYATAQWPARAESSEFLITKDYLHFVLGMTQGKRGKKAAQAIANRDAGISAHINDGLIADLPLEEAVTAALSIVKKSIEENATSAEEGASLAAVSFSNSTINISQAGTMRTILFAPNGTIKNVSTDNTSFRLESPTLLTLTPDAPTYVLIASEGLWNALDNAREHMATTLGRKAPRAPADLANSYVINFIMKKFLTLPKGLSQPEAFQRVLNELCSHALELASEREVTSFSLMLIYITPPVAAPTAPRRGIFSRFIR